MGFTLVNRTLSVLFHEVGLRVGRRPRFFIVAAVLVSLFLGTGFLWVHYENDVEYLYTITNGRYDTEKAAMETYFPTKTKGEFDPSRLTRIGRFARLIIQASDGGTLFRKAVWDEILEADRVVHGASFEWKNEGLQNYSNICGRFGTECYENEFLDLSEAMADIESGELQVSYPVMFNPITYNSHILPINFGGVKLTDDSFSVLTVDAVNLNYIAAIDTDEDDDRGYVWEGAVLEALNEAIPNWKHITVYRQTYRSFGEEQDSNVLSVLPYIAIVISSLGLLLILSSLSTDWVRGKPWAATLGIFCCVFGTLAGGGIVAFAGYPIITPIIAVPFIMLGIGIDDSFVLLAAWRQTDPADSVPKRLAECYAEAGVSITITTLTDMLSFYTGLLTPIPSVQIFSMYAGTCVIFIYLLQLFMFGGIIALSGAQEVDNVHALLCWAKATPKSKAEDKSMLFNLFCTGGIDPKDPHNPKNRSKKVYMTFFRDTFPNFLLSTWGKVIILGLFVVYLGISGYGLTTLEEGLQIKRIYREDSYLYKYIDKEYQYFRTYSHRIQVLITSPIDYSNKTVQKQISNMMEELTRADGLTLEYSENWLITFNSYLSNAELTANVTDEKSFIENLRTYLVDYPRIAKDVKFNQNFSKIIASRYILQSKNWHKSNDEKDLVAFARKVADSQPFNVSLFHPWFHFVDQFLIIQDLTIQLIVVAAGIVMAVAVVFIPNLLCSFFVFLTIATIEVGVMGFMCLWGISLDMISLLCLIMCIGFSVDFTAHICYAYISAEGSAESRIRKALYGLGLPIFQGGVSTVIGVSALWLIPSYIFQTFAKVVFLVILFAGWHGLFVLPVVLLIVQPERFSLTTTLWRTKTYAVAEPKPSSDVISSGKMKVPESNEMKNYKV